MLVACNKPSGISSFDVVKIIRTHFQDKVGHSGTLDPMASGLMILGVGKGTKKLTALIGLDKSYETTIDFSLLTDTWDANFWDKEERFEVLSSNINEQQDNSLSINTPLIKENEEGPFLNKTHSINERQDTPLSINTSLIKGNEEGPFLNKTHSINERQDTPLSINTPLIKGGEGGSFSTTKNSSSRYLYFNPSLTEKARTLRNNPTPAEKKLRYGFLSSHPSKFLRQKPIDNYIVDFYSHGEVLAIEIDGDTHRSNEEIRYDQERTKKLENYGITVIRFTNTEIFNQFESVCERINEVLKQKKDREKVFSKNPLTPPSKGGQELGEQVFLKKNGELIPAPNLDQISLLLDSLLYNQEKETLLPLPTFSAKKQNGKRMYKDARKGKAEIQEKAMKIYHYEILDYTFPLLKLKIAVGSGTYIRSIGYWLGQKLGLGGALVALERTSTGEYALENVGEAQYAKGNIKGGERTIFFKEVELEEIIKKS